MLIAILVLVLVAIGLQTHFTLALNKTKAANRLHAQEQSEFSVKKFQQLQDFTQQQVESTVEKIKELHKGFHEDFSKQQAEFLVEKMLYHSKQAGVLSRLCTAGCRRVVHRYDILSDGGVVCSDCKQKK